MTPGAAARTPVDLAGAEAPGRTDGGSRVRRKERRPSRGARDAEAARRLWDESEALVTAAGPALP